MIRALLILPCATLTAYFGASTPPERAAPVPAALTAALSAPCPDLRPIPDPLFSTLLRINADDARAYDECKLKHAGVVNSYVEAREEMRRYRDGQGD
jgi:hypothetical protein